MKDKTAILAGATAFGCLALAACGSGDHTTPFPPAVSNPGPATQELNTADVLALARKTSETSSPIKVDGGAVAVTPVNDETGEPTVVDGT
jgi:hypothetical protein